MLNVKVRRPLCAALLAFTELITWGWASGEEGRRFIDASKLLQEGVSVSDFVPSGWRIESAISGDLNGDARPDTVLELIEDLPPTANGMPNERYRALLVLIQTATGRLQRIAAAERLLRCSTCFGMLAGPEGGGAEIKVDKGVIIVSELWGSREMIHATLRFRYDPSSNHVVLIGEDIERYDRATGARLRESSNFLTGIKLTEGKRYDEQQDRLTKIPVQRQRIPRIQRFIDDIDYEDYEQ